jgi:hypothetical protein
MPIPLGRRIRVCIQLKRRHPDANLNPSEEINLYPDMLQSAKYDLGTNLHQKVMQLCNTKIKDSGFLPDVTRVAPEK